MSKKKGPASKKEKVKESQVSLDHVKTSELTFEQLQKYALAVHIETENERKIRKMYQVEKMKLVRYWTITVNALRAKGYELRDHMLAFENEDYRMSESVDMALQEKLKEKLDQSSERKALAVMRAELETKEKERTLKKEHQIWTDVNDLKASLVDLETCLRESCTEITYAKQEKLEILTRDALKQRRLDLQRLYKEHKVRRAQLFKQNTIEFSELAHQRRLILKQIRKRNSSKLKRLVMTFDTILSHNFEKVSNLKEQAEHLKRVDTMLIREYMTIKKKFSNMVSIHTEGMRLIHHLQTLLHASKKATNNLERKKKVLAVIHLENNMLTLQADNLELEILEKEKEMKELSERAILARQALTKLCRVDSIDLFRQIDKALINSYEKKVYLFHLLNKTNPNDEAFKKLQVEGGKPLTFQTRNLNNLWRHLSNFKVAYEGIIVIYQRLFKIWGFHSHDYCGIIPRELFLKQAINDSNNKPCS